MVHIKTLPTFPNGALATRVATATRYSYIDDTKNTGHQILVTDVTIIGDMFLRITVGEVNPPSTIAENVYRGW